MRVANEPIRKPITYPYAINLSVCASAGKLRKIRNKSGGQRSVTACREAPSQVQRSPRYQRARELERGSGRRPGLVNCAPSRALHLL